MTEQCVLMTTVKHGANLTEHVMGVPLGAARVIRDEAFRVTFAGVDWIEAINQSSFKIVRETLKRLEKLSQVAVDGLDAMATSVSRVVRGSGEAAGEMVSRTAASITGTNEPLPKPMVGPSA